MGPEQLIGAALRGETPAWPADSTATFDTSVVDAAIDHGVAALLSGAAGVEHWPAGVRRSLAAVLRAEATLEVFRREALAATLSALACGGVPALVLKGAHLAYAHYSRPWLRPRLDADVLVAPHDRTRAGDVLRERGYRAGNHYSGTLVTHQFRYERQGPYGVPDVVDLHWHISNPHLFATALTFEELDTAAVRIHQLGPHARGPCDVHALILACIHRVAHHDNSDRLVWLHDIHLLASALTAEQRDAVVQLATAKRLGAVCAAGCLRARSQFGAALTDQWLSRLERGSGQPEASAAFLQMGRSKVDTLVSDLRTLDGWSSRMRLIAEHLFPPAAYIRQAYGLESPLLLPFCYAHRVAFGVGKWFQRDDHAS